MEEHRPSTRHLQFGITMSEKGKTLNLLTRIGIIDEMTEINMQKPRVL